MVARPAPWPSSPAPSARREAALGLDCSARPSRLGSHAANGYLRCLSASKVRYRRSMRDRLRAGLSKTCTTCGSRPLASSVSRTAGRQGGADFSYFFLLHHTRPMILFTGAGRPVSGMYFVQAQCGIWQCPRSRDCFHWWCVPACWQVSQTGMVIRSAPLRDVPSKYLNGTMSSRCLKHGQHTVIPVPFCPPQPRHTVSVRALSSSSSSSSIRFVFSDNPTGAILGGPPAGMNLSLCVALSARAALGAIVSLILCELTARAVRVFVYPAFTRLTARRREQLIVRELDGLKRRVVARPCIYPLPCARCDSHGSFYAASVHLRSLSHKLESLQASYPHMSVRR